MRFNGIHIPGAVIMASFFDLKARKAAAANGSSATKGDDKKQNTRRQPWVEK